MSQPAPSQPRVVLLSAEYPPLPGGVGDYTAQLADELHAQNVAVVVLTGTTDQQVKKEETAFPVWRTITNWGRGLRRQVETALKEWQADLVHIQYQTGAYAMKPAVNLLPSRLEVPVIVTLHDLRMPYLAPKVAPLRRYVTRLLLESTQQVIVTNREDYARLMALAPPSQDPDIYVLSRPLEPAPLHIPIGTNIEVTANVDRQTVRQELEISPDETLLVYFGMLNRTKGVHTLLDALNMLPPQVRLLIIGGTTQTAADREYAQELEQRMLQLERSERLIRPGYLQPERVSALLQAADIAVLPFTDGAAYRRGSLLAALAHGVPTITTQPRMQLDPSLRQAAVLVAAEQPEALVQAVEQIRADVELRTRLSSQAKALVEQFRWDAIAARHRELYARWGTQANNADPD